MKKQLRTLAAAATLVAAAGAAHAASWNLNIYGASAEGTLWNALAKPFLVDTYGCADANVAVTSSSSNGKAVCTKGTDTYTVRWTTKNSIDGVMAAQGVANTDYAQVNADGTLQCSDPAQRNFVDGCKNVHIGASDVAAEAFTQITNGEYAGPNAEGKPYVARDTNGVIDLTTLSAPATPVVVPFGFFVNKAVKVTTCTGGTNDGALCLSAGDTTYGCPGTKSVPATCDSLKCTGGDKAGLACVANSDCTGTQSVAATCDKHTLDNVTRPMAAMIFSGTSVKWSDFGSVFSVENAAGTQLTDQSITACQRHAGSGTLATLDLAVMHSDWGQSLSQYENNPGSATSGHMFFNDGAKEMMACINGTRGLTTGSQFTDPPAAGGPVGAIGYADADANVGDWTATTKYNGVFGRRDTIRNGLYDFWASQHLYTSAKAAADGVSAQATALINYASNPTNLNRLAAKAPFWAAEKELNYTKASDSAYLNKGTVPGHIQVNP